MKSLLRFLQAVFSSLAIIQAGCATGPATRSSDITPLFQDALFKPPTTPIHASTIFAVDAPMRQFLARNMAPQVVGNDPRRALLDALTKTSGLKLDYDAEETRTAAQAFAAREGNCLSLVIMAAALAQQLGIHVTFQEVYGFDTWQRRDGLSFLSQHVNLVFGQRQPTLRVTSSGWTPMIVDFMPPAKVARAVTRQISEHTIIAMYMNNRAAEVLATGDANEAYWYARAALTSDPTFTAAANTLGVIYWKLGQKAPSERALRFTLAREPANVPALTNLVELLDAEGRDTEAGPVRQQLADAQRHPPFYFYDLGMQALKAQDFADAARQFGKDVAQRPYDDLSHFGLATASMHLGNMPRARRELLAAIENATTEEQRALYRTRLRQWK